jgi:hypothetical protein
MTPALFFLLSCQARPLWYVPGNPAQVIVYRVSSKADINEIK